MPVRPVVIVTGASQGIGAATARWLAAAGADLVLSARNADRLEAVTASLQELGAEVAVISHDVTADEAPTDIVGHGMDRFGRLDALVNNAGTVMPLQRVEQIDVGAWRRSFEVNVIAPVRLAAAALPHLRVTRGRVVNVCSELAESPRHGMGAYCSAKAALLQLTRVLDLEEPDVTAVAYAPGVTDTPMMATLREGGEGTLGSELIDRLQTLHQTHALGKPAERARSLAWLTLHASAPLGGHMVDHTDALVDEAARRLLGSDFP